MGGGGRGSWNYICLSLRATEHWRNNILFWISQEEENQAENLRQPEREKPYLLLVSKTTEQGTLYVPSPPINRFNKGYIYCRRGADRGILNCKCLLNNKVSTNKLTVTYKCPDAVLSSLFLVTTACRLLGGQTKTASAICSPTNH